MFTFHLHLGFHTWGETGVGGRRRRNPPSALRSSTSPARRPWRPWPAFVACLQNARPRAPCAASPGLAEEETPPRSHGSGVIEPRFESGSVGCPRAPLPRSGRSLILTGTRDSIRLRTRVTIRPCSELRAPRPRHGPLRGVTSPRGILSWCSPGPRQHQGPASRLDHTPPASGGVSVAGDGFGPRRHLLAAGPREACPLSTRSALGQPGVTSSLVSHAVNGPWASDAPSPRHVRRAPRAPPAPPP